MSLKTLILKGSAWTFAGHAAAQLIRLASSVVLTRLLFPEAFGIMSLVWMVMYGLEMLSDVGLGPAIIRDKRGDDPDFLNTVWTVQLVRGAALSAVACVIAWPLATFYNEPLLVQLIPVAGLTALISGFGATALHTARRQMAFARLTLLELGSQIAAFIAVVSWALLSPTVWALVGGALIGRLVFVIGSHRFLAGIRNRLRWETSSLRELSVFARWIFLGSVFEFLASQSDRLLLGRYLDMAQLGVYGIALTLTAALHALVIKMNYGVLFPAYGRIVQHEAQRLGPASHRARLGIDVFMVLPIATLMVIGGWLVDFLYDSRYHEAGWMLQVLCLRPLMAATLSSSEVCLVAMGQPKYAFLQNACRAVWILVSIPAGWHLLGLQGVVWAVALSEVPVLVVMWIGLARCRMFSLRSEFRTLAFAALGGIAGLGMQRLLTM
jgi:O-antigen/teichoic acid export membrane protein